MVTIELKGREIPLLYTTLEMKTVQEALGNIDRAISLLTGRNPDAKGSVLDYAEGDDAKSEKDLAENSIFGTAEHLRAVGVWVTVLGNAALEEAGKDPDLTEKWILRAMRPNRVFEAVQKVLNAIEDGMRSEIPPEEKEGPVDVTLEMMEKKREKES